jgi:GT2 family glycosyltransferase
VTLLERGPAAAAYTPAGVAEPADFTRATPAGPRPGDGRPRTEAKFLAVGIRRLWVRGVTYGTFAPRCDGDRFPDPVVVARDFAAMADRGINAVRVYTAPPRWLLDEAEAAGLWVMVGLPWEQHVTFLGERGRDTAILARIREDVASCAGHAAILAYAVGNEIPATVVRWHGRRRVERFLEALCEAVHVADPGALVTYVNFPSTEYLAVRGADFVSFNVYLEDDERLAAYVARLQNLAGERPLMLTELGLDSRRNGLGRQAAVLAEQVRVAFAGGCAGAFVFAWTDAWHRGEDEVLDWDFGLTDRNRLPKPALHAVAAAFADAPLPRRARPPRISVIVCTYNGAATLCECLEGVLALDYPDFEVILVDDGSSDASAAIAHELGIEVITTANRGLSAARNTGLSAATGQIVAYLDDDATPDPDWLSFLAAAFLDTPHAAIGGPNVPPLDETGVAACVANTPGGPTHVLLSDTEAEHLPGCNMAFRRDALRAIGGFDPQFRTAGDDVDVCWRLQEAGQTLGFHPAALVWHRRRGTIRRFWRQQRGYGRAEAMLERKWPERYNAPGQAAWGGRVYGRGTGGLWRRSHVYFGTWGTAAFQPEVEHDAGRLLALAAAPEWYLILGALFGTSLLGVLWAPLLAALVPLLLAAALPVAAAIRGVRAAEFGSERPRRGRLIVLGLVTFGLHLLQPAARLAGRLGHGLVPWRRPQRWRFQIPRPHRRELWSEHWQAHEDRVRDLEAALRRHGTRVWTGGGCDRWDLQAWGGALGAARIRTMCEEHGRGRQLIRCRVWPWIPRWVPVAVAMPAAVGVLAGAQGAWIPGAALVTLAIILLTATVCECGIATASATRAVSASAEECP